MAFSRTFGHQYALVARLAHAQGQEVVWMDANLQHPSTLIMEMIRLWQDGYDVVHCRLDGVCS